MAETFLKYKVPLLSDEIYAELIINDDKKHTITASISEEVGQNTITVMPPSKVINA